MNWLKSVVWPLLKGPIETWLTTRATVIPAAKAAEIAKRLTTPAYTVTPALVQAIATEVGQFAVTELAVFKP